MKNLILLLILITTFSQVAFAERYSMRDCMILPITDTAGNSLGFRVFESLERRLKVDGWCNYTPSSEVIGIFSKYRERLGEYLKDETVLKTVAERLKVGTLIRVTLKYDIDQVEVSLDVVGENGLDIYLSEKTVLSDINANLILTTLLNWLDIYENSIPYDGKVLGVLGDQITFSIPPTKRLIIGQDFQTKRLIGTKKHPLLKKVVEWDSVLLANGKIFNLSRGQGLGSIKVYTTIRKVEVGDWIKLEKPNKKTDFTGKKFIDYSKNSFGKLGELTLAFALSSHTASTTPSGGNIKLGGYLFGIHAEAEAWMTRKYFLLGEFSRNIGALDKQSGNPSSNASGQNSGSLKLAGGFKYLPMGFFYGPQVNIYTGYVSYSYQMDKSAVDGHGENSVSGLLLGLGGNIPLKKNIRVLGSGEIIPFGEFNDDSGVFGSSKSISSMNLKIGVHYFWSPTIKLLGMFNVLNNSIKFSGSTSELAYRDTMFKFGGVFTF